MEKQGDWIKSLHILDRTDEEGGGDPLYPLALDELLCRRAAAGGPAVCHLWRHPGALLIGQRDSRLPQAERACRLLEAAGIPAAVRHSGGAAVPLDWGVVNLSLILPRGLEERESLNADFGRMAELIREALSFTGCTIDVGEVSGAYCPGDFDLSIAGRKFCGIAQRRQARARIVQAFVVAAGKGAERTRLVRDFYAEAAAGADPSRYPQVTDGSTASLQELAALGPAAAERFAAAVRRVVTAGRSAAASAALPAPERAVSRPPAPEIVEAAPPPLELTAAVLPAPDEVRAMAAALRDRYSIHRG